MRIHVNPIVPILLAALCLLPACGEDPVAPAPTSFSVTYDANGAGSGSAPADPSLHDPGTTVALRSNTGGLARTNHVLTGWSYSRDGMLSVYTNHAALVMPASNITLYAAWAPYGFTNNKLGYTLNAAHDGYTLAWSGSHLTNAVIPDAVYGIPVTAIGSNAFLSSGITNVRLPGGLRTIGYGAFTGNQLERITIPDGVTNIGNGAFQGCFTNPAAIVIPAGMRHIGSIAFFDCCVAFVIMGSTPFPIGSMAFGDYTPSSPFHVPILVPVFTRAAFVVAPEWSYYASWIFPTD